MTKILFDIVSGEIDAGEMQQVTVAIEAGPSIFGYLALNDSRQVFRARYHELEADSHSQLAEAIDEIIEQDKFLKYAPQPLILYNFPECQQLPEAYLEPATHRDLVELVYGDLNRGAILCEAIEGWEQYNLFRIPTEVHNLFQRRYPGNRHHHFYSQWLKCSRSQMQMSEGYLAAVFYPNNILVAVTVNQQLQLLQKIAYQTAGDIAFHLLNICSQLQLDPASLPLRISGMIDESSAVFTEIMKYFMRAEFDSFPAATSSPALQEYPSHFFSPLLKLALCEL